MFLLGVWRLIGSQDFTDRHRRCNNFPYGIAISQGGGGDRSLEVHAAANVTGLNAQPERVWRLRTLDKRTGVQVALIAPTTVLPRPHFTTFERRFVGTGIELAMRSRIVDPKEAEKVKSGLADGKSGSLSPRKQLILAKDVCFDRRRASVWNAEKAGNEKDGTS